jgi:hypothetical protein
MLAAGRPGKRSGRLNSGGMPAVACRLTIRPSRRRFAARLNSGIRPRLQEPAIVKCFLHPAVEAVGTCKHCSKGTCPECAIDTGYGVACSGTCKEHVLLLASLMSSTTAATKINRGGAAYLMPAFLFFMGAAFVGHAVFTGRTGQSLAFALVLGGGFIIFGVGLGAVQYAWHKRSRQPGAV